ncbi:MAG: polyprenyl synthetase family protein [Candidatus Ryanbacteria bacterium]|nr:polyprenyl synthetase family protein [Candidatus Ryanbacteria bacterium]
MIKDIEKILRQYYPTHWSKKDIEFFLGKRHLAVLSRSADQGLNQPIRDLLFRGGKRIRPTLFLMLLQAFGLNYKKYLPYAYFLENIHNGTLVFDDIEDGSMLRRGHPTCYLRYGIDTAVNVGAAMHFMPLVLLLKKNQLITTKQQLRIYKIYSEELINLHFGQAADIYWHKTHPNHINFNEYIEMTRLKTGSLMRMSVRLACAVSNRSAEEERKLAEFAELAGIAFQIKDDLLDLEAVDRKKFGKLLGNDISEGKLSLPVLFALKKLNNRDRKKLHNILKMHTLEKGVINDAIILIKKTDAMHRARKIGDHYLIKSLGHLALTSIPLKKQAKVVEFIKSFIERDR